MSTVAATAASTDSTAIHKRQRLSEDCQESEYFQGIEGESAIDTWFLFPSPASSPVGVSDVVIIKPSPGSAAKDNSNGKPKIATIKAIIKSETNPKDSKYLVEISSELSDTDSRASQPSSSQAPASTMVLLPRKRLMKMVGTSLLSSPSSSLALDEQQISVIVTSETCHYRQLANLIGTSDSVLEIGCSTGSTSRYLIQYGKAWTGLDTSDEMLEKCAKYCGIVLNDSGESIEERRFVRANDDDATVVHLAKVDALRDPRGALRAVAVATPSPTAIFLDIGGNRELVNVQRMLRWALRAPFASSVRRIILKSRELAARIRDANEIDPTSGRVSGMVDMTTARLLPKHPQRAPLALSPIDGVKPICRYHNYHVDGCAKHAHGKCPFDHEHCHACLAPGHVGKDCPEFQENGEPPNSNTSKS